MTKLKPGIRIIRKGELRYLAGSGGRPLQFKPWLGDCFSFLYDFLMSKSVFPGKLGADLQKHYSVLAREVAGVHGRRILELGTGSGSAVNFLHSDNKYAGTDISPGLLKQAAKRFLRAGFPDPEFYVASGDDLPFETSEFDLCLCILSLNFIGNVKKMFQEVIASSFPAACSFAAFPSRKEKGSGVRSGAFYIQKRNLKKYALRAGSVLNPFPATTVHSCISGQRNKAEKLSGLTPICCRVGL